ncbi:hypothetical protein M2419_002079 [Sphingobacterium sp. BIGb0116]|nr:hypothetical protein [Sphingobacterium sp. BIGb0116]
MQKPLDLPKIRGFVFSLRSNVILNNKANSVEQALLFILFNLSEF